MFCIYCGKEIPDGSECDCRKQADAQATQLPGSPEPPSPEPPAQTGPAYGAYNDFNYYGGNQYAGGQYGNSQYAGGQYGSSQYAGGQYSGNQYTGGQYGSSQYSGARPSYVDAVPQLSQQHKDIKKILRSPLTLITAILLSANIVLQLIDGFSFEILSILTVVGMWLIYASALKADAPLKPAGLTIHSVVLMIQRVLLCILYALVTILLTILIFIPDELNSFIWEFQRYLSINYNTDFVFTSTVFIILIAIWTCFFLFMLFYNITLRNNVACLKNTAQNMKARHKISAFPAVVFILQFVGSLGSAATYIYTADARNSFFQALVDTIIKEVEESADMELNLSFNITSNYLYVVKMAVSAAVMLLSAIITIRLRSKLNSGSEE